MKPNFRLCDACGRKIPEGMEINIRDFNDLPDHYDKNNNALKETPKETGCTWEFCHVCNKSLLVGIIDSADDKLLSCIQTIVGNMIVNRG